MQHVRWPYSGELGHPIHFLWTNLAEWMKWNSRSNFIFWVEDLRNRPHRFDKGCGLHVKWFPLGWKSRVHVIPDGFFWLCDDSWVQQVPNPAHWKDSTAGEAPVRERRRFKVFRWRSKRQVFCSKDYSEEILSLMSSSVRRATRTDNVVSEGLKLVSRLQEHSFRPPLVPFEASHPGEMLTTMIHLL